MPLHVPSSTYRCDDNRGCLIQFWPPDDEHMCSKHVEAWNKLVVKQKFCASSWLITKINILRCTVSKTQKIVLSVQLILVHIAFAVHKYQPVCFVTHVHARYHTCSSLHSRLKSPLNDSTKLWALNLIYTDHSRVSLYFDTHSKHRRLITIF